LRGLEPAFGRRGDQQRGNQKQFAFRMRIIFVMPAVSKKQQMAAGAALAAKRGRRSKSSLKGASRGMYKSMSKAELRRMAKTRRKKLPKKKRR
jgi:hypothetical protein